MRQRKFGGWWPKELIRVRFFHLELKARKKDRKDELLRLSHTETLPAMALLPPLPDIPVEPVQVEMSQRLPHLPDLAIVPAVGVQATHRGGGGDLNMQAQAMLISLHKTFDGKVAEVIEVLGWNTRLQMAKAPQETHSHNMSPKLRNACRMKNVPQSKHSVWGLGFVGKSPHANTKHAEN